MKKILLVILSIFIFTYYAYAHGAEFVGTISAIDTTNKKVTIKDIDGVELVFAIVPSTEIEIGSRNMEYAKFTDLKVGQHIKVENISGKSKTMVAKDIQIYQNSLN